MIDLMALGGAALSAAQKETAQMAFYALAPNTRRAYSGAVRRLGQWLDGRKLDDAALVEYLQDRFAAGASPATLRMAVSAAVWYLSALELPSPSGRRTKAVMKQLSEKGTDRRRGQSKAMTYDHAIAMLTIGRPLDRAIVALAFMAEMRRSEITALRWGDIEEAEDGMLLIRVRIYKTNRAGGDKDVRLLKNGFAQAVRDLRGADPDAPVIGLGAQRISQRITALGTMTGVPCHVTAHSGRVGLASELTAKGASTTETMLAGNWKTARMVAHYSAGAAAKRGAVAKFL